MQKTKVATDKHRKKEKNTNQLTSKNNMVGFLPTISTLP